MRKKKKKKHPKEEGVWSDFYDNTTLSVQFERIYFKSDMLEKIYECTATIILQNLLDFNTILPLES